jgi:hypothetical protein
MLVLPSSIVDLRLKRVLSVAPLHDDTSDFIPTKERTHLERCRAKFMSGTFKCMTEHAAHLSTLHSRRRQRLSHDKPRPCSCLKHEDRLEIGRGYITCCRDVEEEEAIGGSCGSHKNLHMRAHENGST